MKEIRIYNIPLSGKLISLYPLGGDSDDPIRPIPIIEHAASKIAHDKAGLSLGTPLPEGFECPEAEFHWQWRGEHINEKIAIIELTAEPSFHDTLTQLLKTKERRELFELTTCKEMTIAEYLKKE